MTANERKSHHDRSMTPEKLAQVLNHESYEQLPYNMKRYLKLVKYKQKFANPLGYVKSQLTLPLPEVTSSLNRPYTVDFSQRVKRNSVPSSASKFAANAKKISSTSNRGRGSNQDIIPQHHTDIGFERLDYEDRYHLTCDYTDNTEYCDHSVIDIPTRSKSSSEYRDNDSTTTNRRCNSETLIPLHRCAALNKKNNLDATHGIEHEKSTEEDFQMCQASTLDSTIAPMCDDEEFHTVDWSLFSVTRSKVVEDFHSLMTFEESQGVLIKLWDALYIPSDHRRVFAQSHFSSNNTHNEATILAEINMLLMCREKLVEVLESIQARDVIMQQCESVRTLLNLMQNKGTTDLPPEEEQQELQLLELRDDLMRKKSIVQQISTCLLQQIYDFCEDYSQIIRSNSRGYAEPDCIIYSFIYDGVDMVRELLSDPTSKLPAVSDIEAVCKSEIK